MANLRILINRLAEARDTAMGNPDFHPSPPDPQSWESLLALIRDADGQIPSQQLALLEEARLQYGDWLRQIGHPELERANIDRFRWRAIRICRSISVVDDCGAVPSNKQAMFLRMLQQFVNREDRWPDEGELAAMQARFAGD